jgi:diguanylate cyclase (GGDEF)-like protein/PAS domain S-box-containing protein
VIAFAKRNRWGLILSFAAVGFLLFLFIKARPVDPDTHNLLQADIRELQTRDAELGEVVLQIHYSLISNYDVAVATMRRMEELGALLEQHLQNAALPDTPQVRRELSDLQQRIEQKRLALEQFKSNNSVIKNSLLYLPRMANIVLEQLPKEEALHREQFSLLLRDALLMNINSDKRNRETLKRGIRGIERAIPDLPDRARESADLALRHAKLILEHGNTTTELLLHLSPIGKNNIGSNLELTYLDYYQIQQHKAFRYQLLLFLAAMLTLGYAIYAYYKMVERGHEMRIAATAFETQEGILITDLNKRILRVNSAFTRLTGYSAEEAIGQTPDLLKSGRHDDEFDQIMWQEIVREKYWQGEVWSRRKNGEIYPTWLTTTAVTDEHGKMTHYVSVFTDITLRKLAEEQIHKLAFYDPLTELPNRRLLIDRLRHTMASASRNMAHSAILFIDLDNFKTLNDTKGHDIGDLLLIETAKRLQACVRGGDTVSRLGGDEFVVMMANLSDEMKQAAAQAQMVGEKIRESLNRPYRLRAFEYQSSCSLGISLFRANEVTVDDLLKRADTAMYEAKTAGRNTLRFFDPAMHTVLEARVRLEADLRQAVAEQQFDLFYQIQVNGNNQFIGAEALLRWKHPVRGMVQPDEFMSLAEETGLIVPIGRWALKSACAQIKEWETNPLASQLQIAVNVSMAQFHQADFVEQVSKVLELTGADPTRLKIELTESVVLNSISDAIEKMEALKKLGVRFSMDDFGTGYSSLSYLTQLPLDQLKIDQSFIHNIGAKSTDAVIVQTIIGMANSLSIEVIAEGVETEAQHVFLRQAGCMAYQGYLFGKPVALKEFGDTFLSDSSIGAGVAQGLTSHKT